MLRSKLHCQKGFNLNPFSYKIDLQSLVATNLPRDLKGGGWWNVGFADYSQVVVQGVWYKCVNFGAERGRGADRCPLDAVLFTELLVLMGLRSGFRV